MTKGIFLAAFGKKGYMYAAFNMASSIKYFNPDLQITLACNDALKFELTPDRLSIFDQIISIPEQEYREYGRIDPARFKTNIYSYLPYDENLILDVDGVVLQDLAPLINYLSSKDGFFFTDYIGSGVKEQEIEYMVWANNEVMWQHFKLEPETKVFAVQTSFSYVKKCKEAKSFFTKLKKNYANGIDKSKITLWGGTIADELFYSGTLAQSGIDPSCEVKPIFFGNYYYKGTFEELGKEFYVLSCYGNGLGRTMTKQRYLDYYDRIMRVYLKNFGWEHIYKIPYIMADKHCNNK